MKTKSLNDLREILSEEIDKVRGGKTNAAIVNAITNATGKIISTIKLEMEYAKMLGKTPNIHFIGELPAVTNRKNPKEINESKSLKA